MIIWQTFYRLLATVCNAQWLMENGLSDARIKQNVPFDYGSKSLITQTAEERMAKQYKRIFHIIRWLMLIVNYYRPVQLSITRKQNRLILVVCGMRMRCDFAMKTVKITVLKYCKILWRCRQFRSRQVKLRLIRCGPKYHVVKCTNRLQLQLRKLETEMKNINTAGILLLLLPLLLLLLLLLQ